jgi:tRNA-dihydrouridine synthase
MIGRAAIGYPWIFNEVKHYLRSGEQLPPPSIQQRVDVIRAHLHKSIEWKGNTLGILEMRRHYTNYLKGFPYIKEFRNRLVTLKTLEEIDEVLQDIAIRYNGFIAERNLTTFSTSQLSECA